MQANRRQFLKQTAHAVIGIGTLGALAGAKPPGEGPPLKDPATTTIVDTHQHLWDLSKLQLPWLKSAGPLNRSFLVNDYREAIRGLNVAKAIYMEVDVTPEQHAAEAEYVVGLCQSGNGPTSAAVIGGRPADEGFGAYLRRFKGNAYVKGVRQVLFQAQPEKPFFLERAFVKGVQLLGELGMSFDLCPPASMLEAAIKLVDQCPATRFILDHCGNADVKVFQAAASRTSSEAATRQVRQWRRDIAKAAERKNLICKISGIIASVPKEGWSTGDLAPIVNHCLDCFGPDRVMFGGDWPVCTRATPLRRWVEVLLEIVRPRSYQEQTKLFAGNACRFYGLDCPGAGQKT